MSSTDPTHGLAETIQSLSQIPPAERTEVLQQLKVNVLRGELSLSGLQKTGRKDALVRRLGEAIDAEGRGEGGEGGDESDGLDMDMEFELTTDGHAFFETGRTADDSNEIGDEEAFELTAEGRAFFGGRAGGAEEEELEEEVEDETANGKPPRWLAATPGKRWAEVFFLKYSVCWIVFFFLGIVVPRTYERFDEWGYFLVGLAIALPPLVVPLLLGGGQGTPNTPLLQRFWVKANVWIAILSFIGNYLW